MNNDNGHIDIDALLAKLMAEELSTEEKLVLEAWISQSEENAAYAREMTKVWNMIPESESWKPNKEETESAWRLVDKQTSGSKVIRLPYFLGTAASILLIIALFFFNQNTNDDSTILLAQTDEQAKTIVLADGSNVELLPYSTLKYPKQFAKESRSVELNGKATFNIKSNKNHPFIVNTDIAQIEVLGTKFTVNQNKDSIHVSVEEGLVALSRDNENPAADNKIEISKGESGYLLQDENPVKIEKVQQSINLFYEEQTIADVIEEIELLFGKNIRINDKEFLDCTFTAKFTDTSLEDVLQTISIVFDVEIYEEKDQFIISGKGCLD